MGHGFLHGSLRIIKQSQASPRLEIPHQDCESSIIFPAVDLPLRMEIGGERDGGAAFPKKKRKRRSLVSQSFPTFLEWWSGSAAPLYFTSLILS